MENLLIGVVLGALGVWFAAINNLRFDIYKEKLKAYSEIQHKASQIFNIISRVDIPDRQIKFSELHLEMSEIVYSYVHIISHDVFNQVTKFCCNHNFESISKSDKEFLLDHTLLSHAIRNDLKIEKIDKLNDMLLRTNYKMSEFSKALKKLIDHKSGDLKND
ncbi:MAG: hypothetical protein GF353_12225 [Candidatus Lokiarchaeota archaeon]|nr:hypothetical protein [Candidatus Lokiarchaeota archaeon]